MYTYGYEREAVAAVFRLIDWMIQLPSALEPEFNAELQRLEAEDAMTYVTSIERLGEARGKEIGQKIGQEIGQKIGQTEVLRRLLTRKFGPLPDWVADKLAEADNDQILQWADRVLDETSLQAVFRP